MKALFLILLLLNAGFFAYMQWGDRRPSGESLEAHAPINETKIKVLPPAPMGAPLIQPPAP